VNALKEYLKCEKKFDVVLVGHMSDKRKKICTELENRGIKTLCIDSIFDEKRDKLIAQGKILLNIHYANNYNIYEHFRCDRWIFSGMIVVSEKSTNYEMLDIASVVYFENYDNLVAKVIEILDNYPRVEDEFNNKLCANIDHIRMNRYNTGMNLLTDK
jgi:hypothetical protein